YRVKAKLSFLFNTYYSDPTNSVYAYVLHAPTGVKTKLDPDTYLFPVHTGSLNVTLSWDAITDPYVQHVEILRRKKGTVTWSLRARISKSKTSWVDEHTSPNTEYDYLVRSERDDETGRIGDNAAGSIVSVLTFPESPTDFDAFADKKTIHLSWSHDGNCDGFKIYKKGGMFIWSWTLIKTLNNTQFSYIFNVSDYGTYTYKVVAYNSSGDSPVAPVKTVYVLKPPSGLVATPLSPTSIRLTWNPVDSNASNVLILRSTNGTTFNVYKTLPATTTSYIDTGLTPETTYWYRLWAKKDKNTSEWSNTASATTPPAGSPPSSPTNLSAEAISCQQVDLSWDDNSSDEDNFIVERKEEGGSYSVIATLPANTTSYSDTTVSPETTYYYRVKAHNSWGDSGYSNVVNVTTPACGTPPSAPTNLAAEATSPTEVSLSWTDNSDNEDGFKIERKQEGGTFSVIATLPPNTTTYTDTGLTPDTTYTYRVRAYNSFGYSDYSNEAEVTTPSLITIPEAPTNLTVSDITSESVSLSWTDNSDNEEGFKLYRREKEEADFSLLITLPADTTTYTDDSVEPEKTYYYKVLAFNSAGDSDFSNVVTALIPPSKPEKPANFTITETVGRSVSFSWEFSGSCDGFTIFEVNGTKRRVLEANSDDREATLNDAIYGTHKYVVASYKLSGGNRVYSEDSNEVETYIIRPPTNLFGEVIDKNTIKLKWINNDDNIDKIRIYRRTETTSFHMIAEIPVNNTYTDSSCVPDTTYFYYVVGVKDTPKSISGKSNILTIKTPKDIEQIIIRLYIGKTYYYVNDELLEMDVAPIIREGRTLLPIRYVAEALGAEVGWNGKEQKVTITFKGTTIELWIGKNTARVNGEYKLIDPTNPNVKPIIIPPGRTMLPIRFIAENLGCKVDWDPKLREVKITYPGG
ncbi:MAG: fibronectin type III domain-containing protein, partial [Caldisericia bacterium]|nr:fibronectin type III domain-containing protein [Caldisericia bacterium]